METQTVLDKIIAKSSENTIREIVSNIEVKTDKGKGFIAGVIYYIIFKDLNALCRRVYNERNPTTKLLDAPISIKHTDINNYLFEQWGKDQVAKMDPNKQTLILICVNGDNESIAPILSGVFNLNV